MKLPRYGHTSQYLNGLLYAIGGFTHKDLPNEMPVTQSSCERYSVIDNSWSIVGNMNEPRAFATSIQLDNQYIYVFGGMHDFTVV
jgi:N-acetylneuraminic acid mutarotase